MIVPSREYTNYRMIAIEEVSLLIIERGRTVVEQMSGKGFSKLFAGVVRKTGEKGPWIDCKLREGARRPLTSM